MEEEFVATHETKAGDDKFNLFDHLFLGLLCIVALIVVIATLSFAVGMLAGGIRPIFLKGVEIATGIWM